jgi:hypothetical protein
MGVRKRLPEEVDFAAADLWVSLSHGEDGAIPFHQEEAGGPELLHLGQISVLVQDPGQFRNPLSQGSTKAGPGSFRTAAGASGKEGGENLFAVLLQVPQEFSGQVAVPPWKEGIPGGRKGVDVTGASATGGQHVVPHQAAPLQSREVLSHPGDGQSQFPGRLTHGERATELQKSQDLPPSIGEEIQWRDDLGHSSG